MFFNFFRKKKKRYKVESLLSIEDLEKILKNVVENEDYELASVIRDEIDKIKKNNDN
jgi:protein-arginine kinase activator protein McsA